MNALTVDFGTSDKQNSIYVGLAITVSRFIASDIGKRFIEQMSKSRLLTQQSVLSNGLHALLPGRGTIFWRHACKGHLQVLASRNSTSLSAKRFRRNMTLRTVSATTSEAPTKLKHKALAPLVLPRQASLGLGRSVRPLECFVASRRNTRALPSQACVSSPIAAGKGSCT